MSNTRCGALGSVSVETCFRVWRRNGRTFAASPASSVRHVRSATGAEPITSIVRQKVGVMVWGGEAGLFEPLFDGLHACGGANGITARAHTDVNEGATMRELESECRLVELCDVTQRNTHS